MGKQMNEKMSELAIKPIFEKSDWFTDEFNNVFDKPRVNVDLLCSNCATVKTFIGKAISKTELAARLQMEMQNYNQMYAPFPKLENEDDNDGDILSDCILEVGDTATVQLKCPACGTIVYFCYAIESRALEKREVGRKIYQSYEYRVHRIGEYPNQENSRLQFISKYISDFPIEHGFLIKAERAFYADLGAGAVVYLRKAYEVLIYKLLDEMGVARPSQFRQALEAADKVVNFIPIELKDRAYGLFGEMSNAVHGETDDLFGFNKYELLRDVFMMILDSILEKRKQETLAARISLNNQVKRGGATK